MKANRVTQKAGIRSSQDSSRKRKAVQQRDHSKRAQTVETEAIDDLLVDKTYSCDTDSLLPFLQERIALKMPSDTRYLYTVLDYLNDRMLKMGIVNPGDSEVMLAIDEAIVNAIKHGNKGDCRKAVHIVAELSKCEARFTIKDEGAGFCPEKVPDPTDPARLLEPSGRGILLINHIMDEVCYNQCGNEIQMLKRVARAPGDKELS